MNLEALGRTYHGGAPAPLQPGDLVTAADAPDGAPTWVGEVVATTAGAFGDVSIRMLGSSTDWARAPVTIRPLTDAEAVGLAEMLSGEAWKLCVRGRSLELDGGEVFAMVGPTGRWRLWVPRGSRRGVGGTAYSKRSEGNAGGIAHGKAAASRALILYTIRGQP